MNRRQFLRRSTIITAGGLLTGDAVLEALEQVAHRRVFALGALPVSHMGNYAMQLELPQYSRDGIAQALGLTGDFAGMMPGHQYDRYTAWTHTNTTAPEPLSMQRLADVMAEFHASHPVKPKPAIDDQQYRAQYFGALQLDAVRLLRGKRVDISGDSHT